MIPWKIRRWLTWSLGIVWFLMLILLHETLAAWVRILTERPRAIVQTIGNLSFAFLTRRYPSGFA